MFGRAGPCAAITLAVVSCRAPTQVTLELDTDVPCDRLGGTQITVALRSAIEDREVGAATDACDDATGRIGSLVVVPVDDDDAEFAVRVVAGRGMRVEGCEAPGYGPPAPSEEGCIVSRRALRFLPHTPLVLPISLRAVCVGVICPVEQTCHEGRCVHASCEDLDACEPQPGLCSPGAVEPCGTEAIAADARCSAGARTCSADGSEWSACAPVATECGRILGGGAIDHDVHGDLLLQGIAKAGNNAPVVVGFEQSSVRRGYYATVTVKPEGVSLGHHFAQSASDQIPLDSAWRAVGMASDGRGVVAGDFAGALAFSDLESTKNLKGFTMPDVLIRRFGPADKAWWWQEGLEGQATQVSALAVDASDFVFAAISVRAPLSEEAQPNDVWLRALDSGGKAYAAHRLATLGHSVLGGLAAGTEGRLVAAGVTTGELDLGDGPVGGPTAAPRGFVAALQLSPGATAQYLRTYVGEGEVLPTSVALRPDGSAVVTGELTGSADLGGGTLTATARDGFLLELDPAGEHVHSVLFPSTGEARMGRVAVASDGSVWLVGSFRGAIDLGGGPLQSVADWDGFVARLSPSRAHVFSRRLGGAGEQRAADVALDPEGHAFVTGWFSGTMELEPPLVAPSTGRKLGFVLELSP